MNRFTVCPDCAGQTPVGSVHRCIDGGQAAGQRMAAELLDSLIAWYTNAATAVVPEIRVKARFAHTGAGLLWLYRIAYRIRSRMNGLEKYRDRADMARAACELGGELYR